MERNTRTTAKELKPGDRFYKATDRNKTVLQMEEGAEKKTFFQTYKYWCRADGDRHPQAINPKTEVIFLRHNGTATEAMASPIQPGTTTGDTTALAGRTAEGVPG